MFAQTDPFDPRGHSLRFLDPAAPGYASTPRWRATFARFALQAWDAGGDVWISNRLLAGKPSADSLWAENDDPRLKWSDFPKFFGELILDRAVGGTDGWSKLAQTKEQRHRLSAIAAER